MHDTHMTSKCFGITHKEKKRDFNPALGRKEIPIRHYEENEK